MAANVEPRPQLDFGAQDTLYATHALHAFAAKCPPQLAHWAIDTYSKPGEVVVDPMVGSGTTLVEAVLLGRDAIGSDLDPLARLIAKAKSTPVAPDDLERAGSAVLASFAARRANGSPTPDLPELHQRDRWFLPLVSRDLAVLKACVRDAEVGDDARDLLYVAFSSLITARTSVANARDLVHSRHHYRAHATPPDIGAMFRGRLTRFRRQLADFEQRRRVAPRATTAKVLADDARALSLADGTADLVFTSPPYCNALDYTRAHAFSVGWLADELGLTQAAYIRLGRSYIGTERGTGRIPAAGPPAPPLVRALTTAVAEQDQRRAVIVARYFQDMRRVLAEVARILRPGGRLVLVVCPSHIRKIEIPTHEAFVELGCDLGTPGVRLVREDILERTLDDRRRLLPYMQEAFGRRMRTEYVVVLRREDDGPVN